MIILKTIISLSFTVTSVLALTASSIANCPALPARTSAAKDVTDLRIDDIKMIGALGDSIMAGFGMMGVDHKGTGFLNISTILEYRGNSYGMGGDTDAITIANFIKRYSPNVQGASVLSHLVSYCQGTKCNFPLTLYRPHQDNLNGAQSGGMAMNLDRELDYLIPRMQNYGFTSDFQNDWKMITIQIGSNDQCAACDNDTAQYVTADAYANYIEAAIQRIRAHIPKVVVNLIGSFKISGVLTLSSNNAYCTPENILPSIDKCSCSGSLENWAKMDTLSDAYNSKLKSIADKYKGTPGGSFAVMYSPAPLDLSTFPIDALSNIDCFHPSLKGHQFVAKAFWNQLFLPTSLKTSTIKWQENTPIYCPTDTDRLPTA